MQKTLTAATFAAALAMGGTVQAADVYTGGSLKDAPVYAANTWTGFYAGVNGGYASNTGSDLSGNLDVLWGCDEHCPPRGNYPGKVETSPDGGFGGGQIGYNWQRDRLVYGLEADIQGAGLDSDGTLTSVFGSFHSTSSLDWFGTIRGRLGLTIFDRGLIYATGGFAYGGVEDKLTGTLTGYGTEVHSSSETATGYVLGAGFEYALTPKWSLKAEYQYIDLGNTSLSGGVTNFKDGYCKITTLGDLNSEHAYNTVRVGLNYHIVPAYEPLK